MGKAISRATVMLIAGLIWVFVMSGDSFSKEQQLGGVLIESEYSPEDGSANFVMAADFAEPECLPKGSEAGANWTQTVSLANVSDTDINLHVQYIDADVDDILAPGESVSFEISATAEATSVEYAVLYTFGDNPQENNIFRAETPDKCLADPAEDEKSPAQEFAEKHTDTEDMSASDSDQLTELPETGLNFSSALIMALGFIIIGVFAIRRHATQ